MIPRVINLAEEVSVQTTHFWNSVRSDTLLFWLAIKSRGLVLASLTGIILGFLCLISPMLAVVVSIGIIIIVIALSKPIVLCYLVISVTILTSGIARGRFFPILSVNEVGLIGAVAIALLTVLINRQRKIAIPKYFGMAFIVLIGGMVIIPIVIYLFQGAQLTMTNAFKMINPIQYFLLFLLFAVLPENEADRRKLIWCMLGFGVIVAFVGLLQGFGIGFVNGLLAWLYTSAHESVAARAGRITSLLGSWNTLGMFMMTIILIGWAVLFEINKSIGRFVIMGVMVLSVLCLIASGSYAGVLGSMLGIILLQILSKRKIRALPILIISFIGIFVAILLFYPYIQPLIEKRLSDQFSYGGLVPQTLEYRFKVWREIFIPMIKQNFPLPVSPSVPTYYAWQFEESQYILLLFRTGLAGFLSFITWIGLTIGWLYHCYRTSQGFNKAIVSATLTLVSMLVLAGFTNEVFSFAGSIDYLWILMGLVANSMVNA
jgi:hypothetical protein